MLGFTPAELQARTYKDITHPDDVPASVDSALQLMSGEIDKYSADKRYIRKDGSILWIGLTVALRRDQAGLPQYCIVIVRDITERKEAQEHQRFLMRELSHRTKNQLAVIQAIANQTARNANTVDEFRRNFSQRLQGLATSTDVLVHQNWTGAPLADLVRCQLEPFTASGAKLAAEGPQIPVSAEAAEAIGLALHELATYCAKYGAWSSPTGIVTVSWQLERDGTGAPQLRLSWRERGGPAVTPPSRKGVGQIVVEQMVAQKLGGTVELDFSPAGVSWTLILPATHFGAALKKDRPDMEAALRP